MADINALLSGVINQASALVQSAKDNSLRLQANVAGVQSQEVNIATNQELIGQANATIDTTRSVGQLAVENSIQHAAASVNESTGDPTGSQAARAQALLAAQTERDSARKLIEQKNSVSIFDDPISWVQNKLTVNKDIDHYNAANNQAQEIMAEIDENNHLLTAQAQNYNLQKSTISTASVAAEATRAGAAAAILADNARISALNANTQGIQLLSQMDSHQLTALNTSFDAVARSQMLADSQRRLALEEEAANDRRTKTKQSQDTINYVTDTINRGLKVLDANNPPVSISDPRLLRLISGNGDTSTLDPTLQAAFRVGETNRINETAGLQGRALGRTPVDAASTLKYATLSPDMKAPVNLMVSVMDTLDAGKTPGGVSPETAQAYARAAASKDLPGVKSALNKAVQESFDDQARSASSADSVYHILPVSEIAKAVPGIQNLDLYKKVLSTPVAAGVDTSNPSMVFGLGLAAVRAGTISANDMARDYSALYRIGQLVNVESKNIRGLGVIPQFGYRTKIDIGSYINPTIDNTDTGEVQRAIVKALAVQAANAAALQMYSRP